QNERAVKTRFGRAERVGAATTLEDPISESLKAHERERYRYPQVRVIPPGGPYFKWPWERVFKVSIATQTVNMAYDPENPSANRLPIRKRRPPRWAFRSTICARTFVTSTTIWTANASPRRRAMASRSTRP